MERNTQLIGISVDSNSSHLAWVYDIYLKTGIHIPFPIVSDKMGKIVNMYGMIAPNISTDTTVRNVFIIDPNGIIRAILIYPLSNGRHIPEIIRLLTAMQLSYREGVATPANWCPGDPVVVPSPKTYDELLERVSSSEYDCVSWYLCYKDIY
ncbi:selenocysteine-containing peroxiredoxin PrxU [Tissierella creatinophila DSM 6911]|uniref:Selenocysteine-containing peroxiredoxin PrxU n=1 Tax=Tissierella creatinophila DSM 6911 TaxID=1123403 RepID=A0A1U7M2R0_TISCR|nr:selenocysteine-containing peroxiredoxin PrxU [Tissierella creatinophila DSM 6911]